MSMKCNWPIRAAVAVLLATTPMAGAGAGAETLQDALASAYLTNPQLTGQRAIVRAADSKASPRASSARSRRRNCATSRARSRPHSS